jgi:hypothetical protein
MSVPSKPESIGQKPPSKKKAETAKPKLFYNFKTKFT